MRCDVTQRDQRLTVARYDSDDMTTTSVRRLRQIIAYPVTRKHVSIIAKTTHAPVTGTNDVIIASRHTAAMTAGRSDDTRHEGPCVPIAAACPAATRLTRRVSGRGGSPLGGGRTSPTVLL